MQVGYFSVGIGPTVNPEFVRTIATTAERLGFSTIWAPEHVVLLEEYASKYPYSSGKFPAPVDTPIADPFTTLAYAAACTSKIRPGTGICLVPEHNPLVLAKTVATVDRLSGGRFVFGVGVGWLAEEFQALGVPFDRRAQRTREYIDVMRKLWTQRSSSYQGEFVNFTNVLSYPKPVSEKGCSVTVNSATARCITPTPTSPMDRSSPGSRASGGSLCATAGTLAPGICQPSGRCLMRPATATSIGN